MFVELLADNKIVVRFNRLFVVLERKNLESPLKAGKENRFVCPEEVNKAQVTTTFVVCALTTRAKLVNEMMINRFTGRILSLVL